MSVTLKDIAERAGVSISTVSRVINNDKAKPASKKTADKVWKIVDELGYIPNQNARNLIKGVGVDLEKRKTKTIGCIYTSTRDSLSDPFFPILVWESRNSWKKRDIHWDSSCQSMRKASRIWRSIF